MTVLSLTKPFATDEPFLIVENQLKVGTHAFRLVVIDDEGTQSDPMDAVVQIRDPTTLVPPQIIVTPGPTRPINPIGPVIRPVNPILNPVIPSRGGKPK